MEANTSRKYHHSGKGIFQKHQTKLVVRGQKVGNPESRVRKSLSTRPAICPTNDEAPVPLELEANELEQMWKIRDQDSYSITFAHFWRSLRWFQECTMLAQLFCRKYTATLVVEIKQSNPLLDPAIPQLKCLDVQLCRLVSLPVIQQGAHTTPHWVVCGRPVRCQEPVHGALDWGLTHRAKSTHTVPRKEVLTFLSFSWGPNK